MLLSCPLLSLVLPSSPPQNLLVSGHQLSILHHAAVHSVLPTRSSFNDILLGIKVFLTGEVSLCDLDHQLHLIEAEDSLNLAQSIGQTQQ